MKKLFIYTVLAIGAVASFSSCKKELNALPTQALVEGAVVTDQKSAEVALNGAYAKLAMQTSIFTSASTGWSGVREIMPAQLAGWMQYAFGRSIENTNIFLPTQTSFYWTPNYTQLNAVNITIEEVGKLPDTKFTGSRKKEILGEGSFLRAYAHFNLLAYFSEWYKINSPLGVLLRKEPLRLSNASQERSTVKESYDYILEDLDFAIANAANVRPNYYANKAAAKVLKMRVLMMRGQGSDYADVIALANDVIANTGGTDYQLENKLRDLFQVKGLTSKEVILGITPYASQTGKFRNYQFVQSGVYLTTKDFVNLLQGDPRNTWMYTRIGSLLPVHATMVSQNKLDSFYFTKYHGAKVEESYAIRLTEVYLLKAEAIVRSGGNISDARAILMNIMQRAERTDFTSINNATTPAEMLKEIVLEYSRNMASENGMEYLALLRLPLAAITQIRPTIKAEFQYILPVPTTEFQLNPVFGLQNTGYPK